MVTLKKHWRKLKRSNYRNFETAQLLYAYIFRPKNLFISSKVKLVNKGKINVAGPFYFGIFSNWLMGRPGDKGLLKIAANAEFSAGNNVRISAGSRLNISGKLHIGDNSFMGVNTKLLSTTSITIGSNCAISWNCQFADSDMHTILIDGAQRPVAAPINIGNRVWIGANCSIMKGVTLGEGTVVAAGSVVNKSFPPYCLIGGVPAKILKENIDWKE